MSFSLEKKFLLTQTLAELYKGNNHTKKGDNEHFHCLPCCIDSTIKSQKAFMNDIQLYKNLRVAPHFDLFPNFNKIMPSPSPSPSPSSKTTKTTTTTALSINEIVSLLRRVIDLQHNYPKFKFPSADNLVHALDEMIIELNEFLENSYSMGGSHEFNSFHAIIVNCPEVLGVKCQGGDNIPIYTVAQSKRTAPTYVPLMAYVGRLHHLGGPGGDNDSDKDGGVIDTRGGLLIGENDDNSFHMLTYNKEHGTTILKALLYDFDLPFFFKEDIKHMHLLHHAVARNNVDMVKFFLDLDPDSVRYIDNKGHAPIHYIDCTTFLVKDSIEILHVLLHRNLTQIDRIRDDTLGGTWFLLSMKIFYSLPSACFWCNHLTLIFTFTNNATLENRTACYGTQKLLIKFFD